MLVVAAFTTATAATPPVRLIARSIDYDDVVVPFPAVTYAPPVDTTGPAPAVCARMASDALGVAVDPVGDLVAETEHRVVLRDPSDRGRLLKVYRPDHYTPDQIAKMLQRDLGLEDFLRGLGLRVAAIDRNPRLLERGILRQQRIVGAPLDKLYPTGYPAGADPRIDRMLGRIAAVDQALIRIVSRQSGLLLSNTVDCRNDVPLGVDVGACRGNIFVEQASGDPVLIDW